MAESLTLHGAKDIKRHIGGTDITRMNPKRGGDTHMIRRWWGGAGAAIYEPCVLFKVARAAGEIRLAVPITDSTRLTISYDGADDFTFSNILDVDRIGVLDADMEYIQEYRLPRIVGGKQMKVTPAGNSLPSGGGGGGGGGSATTIGTVTVSKTGSTVSGVDTEVTLQYSFAVSGNATGGTTNVWSVSPSTSVVIADSTAVDTDITLPVGGPYTVTCTVTNAGANDSPASGTDTVTVT